MVVSLVLEISNCFAIDFDNLDKIHEQSTTGRVSSKSSFSSSSIQDANKLQEQFREQDYQARREKEQSRQRYAEERRIGNGSRYYECEFICDRRKKFLEGMLDGKFDDSSSGKIKQTVRADEESEAKDIVQKMCRGVVSNPRDDYNISASSVYCSEKH
jgi:hypothetical protein